MKRAVGPSQSERRRGAFGVPMASVAVGLAFGMWSGELPGSPAPVVIGWVVLTGIAGVLLLAGRGSGALFTVTAFALFGYGLAEATRPDPRDAPTGTAIGVGVITERPSPTPYGIRTTLALDSLVGADTAVVYTHLVTLYADSSLAPSLRPGKLLRAELRFRPFGDSLPQGYRRYLSARDVVGTARLRRVIDAQPSTSLRHLPLHLSERLSSLLDAHLSVESAGLGRALLLGDRSGLSRADRDRFARSGAAHVLAISGAHLSLLLAAVSLALSRAEVNRHGRRRWLWAIALAALMGIYAVVAGGSPPVLRAAVMAALVLVGEALYRKPVALNLHAATVAILLVANPWALFDAGFLLSVSAVTGILLVAVPLSQRYPGRPLLWRWAHDLVLVTLVATLFTLPAVWATFGRFPLWFLPANLVLVPLASVATLVGFVFLLLGWVPGVGSVLALLLEGTLRMLDVTTTYFAELPMATVALPELSALPATALFALLGLVGVWVYRRTPAGSRAPAPTVWL